MDIALIVDKLLPAAQYTRCATYQELQDSWDDARPIPTFGELAAAEVGCMADQAVRDDRPGVQEMVEALLEGDTNPTLDSMRSRLAAAKAL